MNKSQEGREGSLEPAYSVCDKHPLSNVPRTPGAGHVFLKACAIVTSFLAWLLKRDAIVV